MQAQLQHIKVAPNDEMAQMVRRSRGTGAVRLPPRLKDWGWGGGVFEDERFYPVFFVTLIKVAINNRSQY